MTFWAVTPHSTLHTARILHGATTQKITHTHIMVNLTNLTFSEMVYTDMTSAEKERNYESKVMFSFYRREKLIHFTQQLHKDYHHKLQFQE
jgi:extradiol dioxygenase family protein